MNNIKYSQKSILFQKSKDKTQKTYYYNCHCKKYSTNQTSHYFRHLKSFDPSEYLSFLSSQKNYSEINESASFSNY